MKIPNNLYGDILGMTPQGAGKWKKENRPIFNLFKYFSKEELEELLETGKINKLENINTFEKAIYSNTSILLDALNNIEKKYGTEILYYLSQIFLIDNIIIDISSNIEEWIENKIFDYEYCNNLYDIHQSSYFHKIDTSNAKKVENSDNNIEDIGDNLHLLGKTYELEDENEDVYIQYYKDNLEVKNMIVLMQPILIDIIIQNDLLKHEHIINYSKIKKLDNLISFSLDLKNIEYLNTSIKLYTFYNIYNAIHRYRGSIELKNKINHTIILTKNIVTEHSFENLKQTRYLESRKLINKIDKQIKSSIEKLIQQ